MKKRNMARLVPALALIAAGCGAHAAENPCDAAHGGEIAPLLEAIAAFRPQLSPAQLALFDRPLTREAAIRWSNLPIGVVPREGLRLGDLDAAQTEASQRIFAAALSACGVKLLEEVRRADDFLSTVDTRKIGWHGGNYYLSVLGKPSAKTPWILQLGGHHLAYNLTFNGHLPSATPLFLGTEPIRFEIGGVGYEPLTVQSDAMRRLARSIESRSDARLSGTFTDVVKGVVVIPVPGKLPSGGMDTGFPHTYPTGDVDRGARYDKLTSDQQQLVRHALRSYASLPGAAISQPLVAAYESADALRETYVGYSGASDLSAKGSYVRIDGPRIWMEFVVQPAVANPAEMHYHALWRDKQADYGGEVR